jgi:hypothetical protein
MNEEFTLQREAEMIKHRHMWPGETLCLKKRPKSGELTGVMGYAAYGILTSNMLPLIVYLRPNFVVEQRYATVEALLDDGWIVD